MQRELDQTKNDEYQDADPPCQDAEKMEQEQDRCRRRKEESLPERYAENLSFVPCVERGPFPEEKERKRRDARNRKENTREKRGQRLSGIQNRAHSQHHRHKGGDREKGRYDD